MNWSKLKNSKIFGMAMAGCIVVAGIAIARQLLSVEPTGAPTKAFFTTDDTSSEAALAALFVDEVDRLAPFDHNGKPACRAYVFSCDGGRTKFISHLERYTPEGLKMMQGMFAKGGRSAPGAAEIEQQVAARGIEIKRPGDAGWVLQSNEEQAGAILNVRCPDGTRENLDAVWAR